MNIIQKLPVQKSPWVTRSTRPIYKNPWITVREDDVICPDGSNGIYGVVEAKIATGVLALDDEMNVYLVGQYRYPTDYYSWEIIEGGAEDGEAPLHAAQRELKEEAGLEATDWEELGGEIHLSNCFTSEKGYLFVARNLREVPKNPDSTEDIKTIKIPFEECIDRIRSGEITDALTIIAVLRYQTFCLAKL
jgi:8-oxo-dGTP pyrophosphatase MutT (NUDIX family)